MDALVLRDVDLDAVAEAEQPLGAIALPDDGVEGGEQRGGGDTSGDREVGRNVRLRCQPSTSTGSSSPASTSSAMRALASTLGSR